MGELDGDDGDDGGCCAGPFVGAVVLPPGEKQQQEQGEWGLVSAVAAGVVAADDGQMGGPLLSDDMFGELMELMCPPWDPMRVRGEGGGGRLVLPRAFPAAAAAASGGGGGGGFDGNL